MRQNLLFRHARVVDGTGRPSFTGDVLCQNGIIVQVGDVASAEGATIIDADGLCLSPGFIDIHSHSDTVTLVDPRAYSKVAQGVTTDVAGQCGFSAAPLGSRSGVVASAVESSLADYGVPLTWLSYGEYLAALEDRGMAVNMAGLVGHGTLRSIVIGDDARPASSEDVAKMAGFLMDALVEGAFGLSSGLEYPPGFFAGTEELSGVAVPVAKRGGIYATHMRDEGEALITSVKEAITVAKNSGARLEVSHLKAVGPANFGRVREALGLLEEANRQGVDATADVYPYTASSTSLGIVLPEWAHDGGRKAAVQRLLDPAIRAQLRQAAMELTEKNGGWNRIVVTFVRGEANKRFEGMDLVAIGRVMGLDACDAAFHLLVTEEMQVSIVRHGMSPEDVAQVISHPLVMVCSDGRALATDGALAREGKVHPRNYGTFPRVLAKYVREDGLLGLETAIHKMTGFPASKLGLARRGAVKAGHFADLVVFDALRVNDTGTFSEPCSYPEGIEGVWVNGVRVIEGGRHTGATPGRALRMGRAT